MNQSTGISALFFFLLFVCFFGCQSNSMDDFREKGRAKTRSLLMEFKKIRTKDQLIAKESSLKKTYEEIIYLAWQAKQFQLSHPSSHMASLTVQDRELNDQLHFEILRISRLDGGKEILENCQKCALAKILE